MTYDDYSKRVTSSVWPMLKPIPLSYEELKRMSTISAEPELPLGDSAQLRGPDDMGYCYRCGIWLMRYEAWWLRRLECNSHWYHFVCKICAGIFENAGTVTLKVDV